MKENINTKFKSVLIKRLLITLGIVCLVRIGTFLPIPGINAEDLSYYLQNHSITKTLVSTFAGNNTFVIGLFTLNIFPYINASIFMQLILSFSPKLAKLQKEGDLAGKRSINKLIRAFTLIFAIIQSISLAFYLKQILFDWNFLLAIEISLWLTTGAMIILWLSELITEYGLGNGASLFIFINIISNFPTLFNSFLNETQIFNIANSIALIIIMISIYGMIYLQDGSRHIPLISSKQLNQNSGQELLRSESYIPLRFNQAGVMPIILTTTLLVVPAYISNLGLFTKINVPLDFNELKFFYWIIYFGFIVLFSSFYARIVLNPKDLSDRLQEMAVSIPGVRPGIETTFYLKQLMKRITLIGAIILATVVTIPNISESVLNITSLNSLSSTSFLIIIGVVSDLAREIENIYYSNVYNNQY